jgi:4-aminobutyrate aminotransferase-like enzyme
LSNPCPSVGAFSAAIARLEAKGRRLAMSILDGVMQSDGVLQLEPADVQALVTLTHRAGGLWCADEVQGGHGHLGKFGRARKDQTHVGVSEARFSARLFGL